VTFEERMEYAVRGFEITGVVILVAGSAMALGGFVLAIGRGEREGAYERLRQGIGRAILLGLEILIIADIVLTITVDTTVESALTLGLVVLVRTFLSFSLEIELEGVVPWRRDQPRRARANHPQGAMQTPSAEADGRADADLE
jgi:uncharacterized membrane protein